MFTRRGLLVVTLAVLLCSVACIDQSSHTGNRVASLPVKLSAKLSSREFLCTQVQGVSAVTAWFGAGFKTAPGIDGSRWQAMATHAAFIEKWTDPDNEVWELPIQSPCAQHSTTPDRIVFSTVNWHYQTQQEWQVAISNVIPVIKAKYPSVKRIELITMIRAPNNLPCTTGGVSHEQAVLPALDQAIAAVANQSGGLVTVGPRLFAPDCSVFAGATANFNPGAYAAVANAVAAAFAAEP